MATAEKFSMSEVVKLWDSGKGVAEVAEILNITRGQVLWTFRELGLSLYRPPEVRPVSRNIRPYKRGEEHANWKGDKASAKAGRNRCQKMFPVRQCEICGDDCKDCGRLHRHHKDGNTLNNTPENVQVLCARCHSLTHVRIAYSPFQDETDNDVIESLLAIV